MQVACQIGTEESKL